VRLLLAVLLVAFLVRPAAAAEVQIAACPTILSSLWTDWQNTRELLRIPSSYETNPVIRALGPDLYFASLFGFLAVCRENRAWRVASVVLWVVQTYYVNASAEVRYVPLLFVTVRW